MLKLGGTGQHLAVAVIVVDPAEVTRVVTAIGRYRHPLIGRASEGLLWLRALALLLPVVFHFAFDGGPFPDIGIHMRGLPGKLVLGPPGWLAADGGESVIVDAEATLHELRVRVPDEHRFEGLLKRFREQAALPDGRRGIVMLAPVSDEAH